MGRINSALKWQEWLMLLISLAGIGLFQGCGRDRLPEGRSSSPERMEFSLSKISEIPLQLTSKSALSQITSVSINRRKNEIIVADRNRPGVLVFSGKGAFLREIGRPGKGPGEFVSPSQVLQTKLGEVTVYDATLHRLSIFDSLGSFKSSINIALPAVQFHPYKANGYIVYSSISQPYALGLIDSSGTILKKFCEFGSHRISVGTPCSALGNDEEIFVADPFSFEVRKYSGEGLLLLRSLHRPPKSLSFQEIIPSRDPRETARSLRSSSILLGMKYLPSQQALFLIYTGESGKWYVTFLNRELLPSDQVVELEHPYVLADIDEGLIYTVVMPKDLRTNPALAVYRIVEKSL